MRRIAAICALLAGTAGLAASTAGGEDGAYEVRGIFDNGAFVVEGVDVRVAGAKVGTVSDVDVTLPGEAVHEDGSQDPGKAVVVMSIDDPAFQDFRQDASCLIRPQSLLGEKYVECETTQPHAPGTRLPPELEAIPDGEPGAGERFLPLERNGKAVDLDLVNNIMRQPYPDRFRLILNDLGAGLAARGPDLAAVVERSNPALRETNEVLAILARQNRALSRLAADGDAVLAPLARVRRNISGFINNATVSGQAAAERRLDIEAGLQRLPQFLSELRGTMRQLRSFSDQATPVLSDLGNAAPAITRVTSDLGPFSRSASTALRSLGHATGRSRSDVVASDPVIRDVRDVAITGRSPTRNLAKLLASVRRTDGFDFLLRLVFYTAGSTNAFDSFGHFLRAQLPTNNCVDYEVVAEPGCSTQFVPTTLSALAPARPRGTTALEPARPTTRREPRADTPAPDAALSPHPTAPEAWSPEGSEEDGSWQRMREARALLDFLVGDPSSGQPEGGRR